MACSLRNNSSSHQIRSISKFRLLGIITQFESMQLFHFSYYTCNRILKGKHRTSMYKYIDIIKHDIAENGMCESLS